MILEAPYTPDPYSNSGMRSFRLCVPDEWYRRSKSRSSSATPLKPSEDTLRHLARLEESEEESEDGEGTAKMTDPLNPTQVSSLPSSASITSISASSGWRSSISQNRLSSLFESWVGPSSAGSSPDRKTVSDPILVGNVPGSPTSNNMASSASLPRDGDNSDLEELLVRPWSEGMHRE